MSEISIYDKMTNAEKQVANLLKNLGLKWTYEQPVFVWDDNKRPRVWAPDFYLVQFGIYVEVCGSRDFDYSYRKEIYEKNGYHVVFLHLYKKSNKWKKYLFVILKMILEGRQKYLERNLRDFRYLIQQ